MMPNRPHMDKQAQTMDESSLPVQKTKENAHSLRRYYPVQVQRDFLSLPCLHLGLTTRAEADADTPTASN